MTMTMVGKKRGRRPGHADTKQAILDAALSLFSQHGYDKVSLRSIARAAEVDPALIHHYFDGKGDLFTKSVLDLELNPEDLLRFVLDGPRESIGERTVLGFLDIWNSPGIDERFTALIRAAAAEGTGRRPFTEFLFKEVLVKIAESAGHPDASERASLAVAVVIGLVMGRAVLQFPGLTVLSDAALTRTVGQQFQWLLVDDRT
ncbi:MAG: TetR family transcriptional regulator [Propionicimonas sp.]